MKKFWDSRYSEPSWAYGLNPNDFFKNQLDQISEAGTLLLPCEGEGRNAVYAASRGWDVHAFDYSDVAREKALSWASESSVHIHYETADVSEYIFEGEKYDIIAFIYAHFHNDVRKEIHQKAIRALKPSGKIIIEAFHMRQLGNDSGGPQNSDMLYNKNKLLEDFNGMHIILLEEMSVVLDEGLYHKGLSHVIRLVAEKIS